MHLQEEKEVRVGSLTPCKLKISKAEDPSNRVSVSSEGLLFEIFQGDMASNRCSSSFHALLRKNLLSRGKINGTTVGWRVRDRNDTDETPNNGNDTCYNETVVWNVVSI